MKAFEAEDGSRWSARIHDGAEERAGLLTRVGWEAILFESDAAPPEQRLVYRPAGWLHTAGRDELASALREAESIRTTWGATSRDV